MNADRRVAYSPLVWRLFTFTVIVGVATGLPEIMFNFYLASLGFDNAIAGQMVSLTRISGFLFGIPLGLAVDRFGGVRTIQWVGVVNIVTWLVLLNTTDIHIIRVGYFFAGVLFTAQATAILPLLSKVTTPEQRPFLFGVNFALIMTTGIISALIGGSLPGVLAQLQGIEATSVEAYRYALYSGILLTILAIISLIGMHARISQPHAQMHNPTDHTESSHTDESASHESIPRRFIVYRSLGRLTLGMAGGMLHPFLNLYLRQQYAFSDATIGVVIAVFSLASVVAGFASGSMIKRIGAQRTVVISAGIAGCVMATVLLPNPFIFMIAYTISMFLIGQVYPAGDVLILSTVGAQQRGFTTSINNMLWSFGWAAAASISGWLQVQGGFTWPIIVHCLCMAITALLFYVNQYPIYGTATKAVTTP